MISSVTKVKTGWLFRATLAILILSAAAFLVRTSDSLKPVVREERPDVDRVYMTAVQAMTGSGGWPMSVFLTPDLVPFLGATYIPPTARYGRPGFTDIVRHVSDLWKNDRSKILETGKQIEEILQKSARSAPAKVEDSALREGFKQIEAGYAPLHGGFGSGLKFP